MKSSNFVTDDYTFSNNLTVGTISTGASSTKNILLGRPRLAISHSPNQPQKPLTTHTASTMSHLTAGRICTNHFGATEGLYGGQVLDQYVALRHALAAHGEGEGDGREQTLRRVRHDDADPEGGADPEAESGA